MIVAVDVHYSVTGAVAAGILFNEWDSTTAQIEVVECIKKIEPYEAGRFYLRELPCLRSLLEGVRSQFETVLIDGYVWLGPNNRPGLGAHLYNSLGGTAAVIGVAKSLFHGALNAIPVHRGRSIRPLFVSAVGMDPVMAARHVRHMHGPHRIPTLLKRVDSLTREQFRNFLIARPKPAGSRGPS